jgi:hypothetical protein
MSVLNEDGKCEIECDTCEKSPTGKAYDRDDFDQMVTDAKLAGVDFKRDGRGGWIHTCRPCRIQRQATLLRG